MSTRINRILTAAAIACLVAASTAAQTAREVRGAAAVEPLQDGPPAKIILDPPLAEPLSHGRIVIQYRTDIHVTVDDLAWHWLDASGVPVIIQRLAPGPHKSLIQLVNANHQPIDQGTIQVTVPAAKPQPEAHQRSESSL
jgi:hypothetical protein